MSAPTDKRVEQVLGEILAAPTPPPAPFDLVPGILSIPDRVRPHPSRLAISGMAAAAACLLAFAWIAWSGPAETPRTPTAIVAKAPTIAARIHAVLSVAGPVPEATREEFGDGALIHLHRIATDEDPVVAKRAIDWLARIRSPRSLPSLITAADMEDRQVPATEALSAIGPRALPAIVPLLDRPAVFETALAAVVAIGGPRAVDALALSVAASEDPGRRRRLLAALGEVDGREGTRRLLAFLTDDERGGEALEVLSTHREKMVPHLIDLTHEPGALAALGLLAPPEAVPALRRCLEDRDTRTLAARALARIDTAEAISALLEYRSDPAVLSAARFGGPGLERELIAALEDASPGERTRLIALLGEAGGNDSVTVLAALAGDPAVGPGIVRALGRIGTTSAITALARLGLQSHLRRTVLSALGATGDALAVAELVRLGRNHRGIRRAACRALARIPAASAIEGILLLEREGGLGGEVHRSLERMDVDLVRSTLTSLSAGELKSEAKRALRGLGVSAGPPRAVSLL